MYHIIDEKGRVKVEHFSTSSSIKISIRIDEEISQGTTKEVTRELWLEYDHYNDLKEILSAYKLW